jgi:hypothetical protein
MLPSPDQYQDWREFARALVALLEQDGVDTAQQVLSAPASGGGGSGGGGGGTGPIPTGYRAVWLSPAASALYLGNNAYDPPVAGDLFAIDTAQLADAAISINKLRDGAVGSAKLQDLAVVTAKIGDAAILTAKIGELQVVTGKIADLAVNTLKVANAAITSAKIANLAVGNAQIAYEISSAGWNAATGDGWLIDRLGNIQGKSLQLFSASGASMSSNEVFLRFGGVENGVSTLTSGLAAANSLITTTAGNVAAVQAAVGTETTARIAGDSALATSITGLSASFTTLAARDDGLNGNPAFTDWAAGSALPARWSVWQNGSGSKQAGLRGPNAFEQVTTALDGFALVVTPAQEAGFANVQQGYFVLELDVVLVAGTLRGAGLAAQLYNIGVTAVSQQSLELFAEFGAGVVGRRYAVNKLVQFSGLANSDILQLFLWSNTTGLAGGGGAKTLRWHYAAIRAATQAEIEARTATAAITAEATVRASADTALATQLNAVSATTSANSAAISTEVTARTSAVSAVATTVSNLQTTVAGNLAAINAEASTRSTADSAMTARLDTQATAIAGNTAAITSEASARATADSALTTRLDTQVATVAGNTAAITSEATTRAAADSAIAGQITNISATVGTNTTAITTAQTAIAGVQARYGLRLNVNGFVTGFEQNNSGSSGSFKIYADEFGLYNPSTGQSLFSVVGPLTKMQNVEVDTIKVNSVGSAQLQPQAVAKIAFARQEKPFALPAYTTRQILSLTVVKEMADSLLECFACTAVFSPNDIKSKLYLERAVFASGQQQSTTIVASSFCQIAGAGQEPAGSPLVLFDILSGLPAGSYTFLLWLSNEYPTAIDLTSDLILKITELKNY